MSYIYRPNAINPLPVAPNLIQNNVINPLLLPHGQLWGDVGEVLLDSNAHNAFKRPTTLVFPHGTPNINDIKALDYFYLLFPMSFLISTILPHTNEKLRNSNKQLSCEGEILKFLGITLAMAYDPCRGGVNAYWETAGSTEYEWCLRYGKDYGKRFGMSKKARL